MELDQKAKIDQACRTAEEFSKLYYDSLDKRRHLMSKLYLGTGILTWNGNGIIGTERIQKFFNDLPPTDHSLSTMDAHPIPTSVIGGQLSVVIQVSGIVKYQDKLPKSFQQNFVITAQLDKWKIITDCFRLQEPLSNLNKS